MKRILFIGDCPYSNTGMARVAREFTNYFSPRVDKIIHYSWNTHNLVYSPQYNNVDVVSVLSNNHILTEEDIKIIYNIINSENIDTIFCQGDIFYFRNIGLLKEYYIDNNTNNNYFNQSLVKVKTPKIVGYFNIDGEITNPVLYKSILKEFDVVITSSNFAKNEIETKCFLKAESVYHGVDTNIFHKIDNIAKSPNVLILGSVIQLSLRKNIISLLQALSRIKEKLDFMLLLIVKESKEFTKTHLLNLINHYDLNNNIIIQTDIKDDELCKFYNRLDFYITTSLGEGFGLPVLEAFACGVPVIAPDNTSFTELLSSSRGILVNSYNKFLSNISQLLLTLPDIISLKDAIIKAKEIKSNKKLYNKMSENVINFAKSHTWEATFSKIETIINNNINNNKSIVFYNNPVIEDLFPKFYSKKRHNIAIYKCGGIGDNIQIIPLADYLRKQYPDYNIDIIIERNPEVFFLEKSPSWNRVIPTGISYQTTMIKTIYESGNYDYIYDIRYVSRIIDVVKKELSINDFFLKYKSFYYNFPYINNQLSKINMHVIDIMRESLGIKDELKLSIKNLIEIPYTIKDVPDNFILLNLSANIPKTKEVDITKYCDYFSNTYKDKTFVLTGYGIVNKEYPNIINLLNQTTFWDLVYLIIKASKIVTLDNGVMWLSKYLNKKDVIVLFGPTPVVNFGFKEFTNLSNNLCEPCWWNNPADLKNCPVGKKICQNYILEVKL